MSVIHEFLGNEWKHQVFFDVEKIFRDSIDSCIPYFVKYKTPLNIKYHSISVALVTFFLVTHMKFSVDSPFRRNFSGFLRQVESKRAGDVLGFFFIGYSVRLFCMILVRLWKYAVGKAMRMVK